MNNYPTIHPELTWRLLDGEAVIVSPTTGEIRVLNQVGAEIWQMIANGLSVPHIATTLCEQYGLSDQEAEMDIATFLADLAGRGLITWHT